MRLPDFLIIGAMKAGTTTLFRDLMAGGQVFFPIDKEPERLCDDRVLTPEGRASYAALFAKASPGQLCAEASTAYTKLPVHEGVVERARRVLPDHAKFLYIVRDPVSRALSQHKHELAVGRLETVPDAGEAVRRYGRYLDYSRYAMQLGPWLSAFGPERVRVVLFEAYVKSRAETVAAVSRFLGIEPRPDLIRADEVFNRADSRVDPRGIMRWFRGSALYQRVIRPSLSTEMRHKLRQSLLPRVPDRSIPADDETMAWMLEQLLPDMRRFSEIVSAYKVLVPEGVEPLEQWLSRTHRRGEVTAG